MNRPAEAVLAVFVVLAMVLSMPIYALVSFIQTQRRQGVGSH